MLATCQLILSDFRRTWTGLLGCEIAFKVLGLALLGPVIAWTVLQLIALSGQAAISNVEIADFLLSPLGWLTLVIFIGLGWALVFLGHAALLHVQIGRLSNKPQSPTQATIATFRRAPVIIELAIVFVVVSLMVASPFLVTALIIYRWLLSEFDINYYLSEQPPEFLWALTLAGILAVGLAIVWAFVYSRTLFALPECVLNLRRPIASLSRSFQMTGNHTWIVFKWLVGWLVVCSLVSALVTVVVQVVEYLSMQAAGDSFPAVALVIGLLLTLNLVAGVLTTIFGNVSQSLLIGRLYWSELTKAAPLYPANDPQSVDKSCPDLPGLAISIADHQPDQQSSKPTWFTTKRIVAASISLVAVSSLGFCLLVLSTVKYEDDVQVTAHRGSSKDAPENTLAAIGQAITDGADYAEIDVQETSDGVVIVMHDADLMRIAGQQRGIWDTPLADLKKIDAGSWFDTSFADQRVPTLQEVLDLCRGKIKLNIELKFNGHDQHLVTRTLDVVTQNHFATQCVISSLKQDALPEVRAIQPGIKVGAIVGAAIGNLGRVDADFISINVEHVGRKLIDDLHQQGKEIHVWTVNDVQTMSDMIDLGVDNILTDEPAKLNRLLEERRRLSEPQRMLLAFRKLIEY